MPSPDATCRGANRGTRQPRDLGGHRLERRVRASPRYALNAGCTHTVNEVPAQSGV